MVIDSLEQLPESVDLCGKLGCDLVFKQRKVVGEAQSVTGEDNRRLVLRCEPEVVPAQTQLPQQLAERPGFCSGGGVVRHGMQADVVVAAPQAVE